MKSAERTPTLVTRLSQDGVRPGDYFHSERDLYRVEEVAGQRVLVEDCRSGILVEMELEQVRALEPVRR